MGQDATVRRPTDGHERTEPRGGTLPSSDSPPPNEFSVGDRLRDGRYELVEVLGRGGMGTVFLAKDHELKSDVAIKVLGADFASHPDAKKAFKAEAKKSLDCTHPNVVRVRDFDIDKVRRSPYIVMEYMRGQPLDEVIKGYPNGLRFDEAWPIVQQMGHGLACIHETMVHCDFKPGNVFRTEDGKVKILDLGIARATSQARSAETTMFDVGTLNALAPAYASREMFEHQPPDKRDDIYGFGCTVYELLTGRHPFGGKWAIAAEGLTVERVEGLNDRRWGAVERALALRREDRIESVEKFLEKFEDKPNPWLRRLVVVGVLSAIIATALGAVLFRGNPDESYVRDLLDQAGTRPVSEENQSNIVNWLAQGNDYLGFARDSFARSDADGAHRDLRGGADTAEQAFRAVLALTPSEDAARGMLQIVETYAEGAANLADSDPETALWVACQGYDMHPNHVQLRSLIQGLGSGADIAGVCVANRP